MHLQGRAIPLWGTYPASFSILERLSWKCPGHLKHLSFRQNAVLAGAFLLYRLIKTSFRMRNTGRLWGSHGALTHPRVSPRAFRAS